MSYYDLWSRPYVSVAEKRRRAQLEMGQAVDNVPLDLTNAGEF